ncbi:hypothetical protein RN001_005851 [Aquatica leii]|uniref:Uncharacterized protein n=1 Tax=Aquatica leii TaxID=1421715 RepID=A0AAN7Q1V6_9COLE|nr:hypothetical protein RN001_005851 [Aquatica leii]
MTIPQYAARPDLKEQSTSELTATLTPLEMNIANRLTIVEVPRKSRSLMKVPVLLTIDMKTAIDKLIETTIPSGISNDNLYVFARGNMSERYLRGHDCLRLFCNEANLQKPRLITSLPNAEEPECESEEDTANNLVQNPVSVTSADVVSRTDIYFLLFVKIISTQYS